MATVDTFKVAVRDALEQSGTLKKMQAEIRSQIITSLADPVDVTAGGSSGSATSSQTGVINELIREYLAFNGYRSTLSVFVPETGLPSDSVSRDICERTVGVPAGPNGVQLPLLYTLAQRRPQQGS